MMRCFSTDDRDFDFGNLFFTKGLSRFLICHFVVVSIEHTLPLDGLHTHPNPPAKKISALLKQEISIV